MFVEALEKGIFSLNALCDVGPELMAKAVIGPEECILQLVSEVSINEEILKAAGNCLVNIMKARFTDLDDKQKHHLFSRYSSAYIKALSGNEAKVIDKIGYAFKELIIKGGEYMNEYEVRQMAGNLFHIISYSNSRIEEVPRYMAPSDNPEEDMEE